MMEEARRHSVDIPISRTLMALMRSRSLRDPDTNSLSKFNSLLEKSNREFKEFGPRSDLNNLSRHSFSCALHARMENRIDEFEGLECNFDNSSSSNLNEKYKPRSFDELIGQKTVVKSLSSEISRGIFSQVYLFHGPNGTGKTSCARILAAFINCQSLNSPEPCGFCHNCLLVFANKSRDVKEFKASKLNSKPKIASLIKAASFLPLKLQFMVFIIENCHDLSTETWNFLCTKLELIPKYLVLIMVTNNSESLPNGFVEKCQIYHFGKIETNYVANRLRFICMKEGFDFEEDALDLLARKCDGSIRVAINVLEQLSLLGKRISRTNIYELIGDVSEEELMELLKLSFSSDAASIVIRAREIMSSRVDPTQLSSQLANLIMDIMAGKCHQQQFLDGLGAHSLRNALEILSETEKQLKAAKNPSTWLTAALLQFNSTGENLIHSDSSTPFAKPLEQINYKPADELVRTSLDENLENSCLGQNGGVNHLEHHLQEPEILDIIWRRAIENCESKPLHDLLLNDSKLSSIYFYQGVSIAEIELDNNENSIESEESLEPIIVSLQSVLGCKVEIKMNPCRIVKSDIVTTTQGILEPRKKYEEIIVTSSRDEGNNLKFEETKGRKGYSKAKALLMKCFCFKKLFLCCARGEDLHVGETSDPY